VLQATIAIATLIGVVLGLWIGYSDAGLGGSLLWGLLLGVGGWLIGRAIGSTATLVARFWQVALGVALFVSAIVMTWQVRF
jgi:hypothetical protein